MIVGYDRHIEIEGRVIPAVNIQVNGYPNSEYPIYFEIMFEDGDLWVIFQYIDESNIYVELFDDWAHNPKDAPDNVVVFNNWLEFRTDYDRKVK